MRTIAKITLALLAAAAGLGSTMADAAEAKRPEPGSFNRSRIKFKRRCDFSATLSP